MLSTTRAAVRNAIVTAATRRGIKSVGPGRSSVAEVRATVFGCTGALGRYVVHKLGRIGTAVTVPHREHDQDSTRHLMVMGDVGMINQQPFHVRDLDSIAGCVKHSNVVINLLGKQELTRNFDLFGSNVEATHNIARVSKEMGVEHFVHISAVAADENSPSEFLRRKAEAEAKVLEYYPNATILRTNVMFAEEDRFLNLIAKWGKIFGFVPLIGSGSNKLRPVYIDDVAEAVFQVVFDEKLRDRTYELNGPDEMTLREVARWTLDTCWMNGVKVRSIAPDLSGWVPAGASPHEWGGAVADRLYRFWPSVLPGPPQLLGARGDHASFGAVDWVANKKLAQFKHLGIDPQNMAVLAPEFLRHYRRGGNFVKVHADERGTGI